MVTGNVIESAPAYGIMIGWGPHLRDVSVTDNLIRDVLIGIGVSVDPSAGTAVITKKSDRRRQGRGDPRHERTGLDRPRPREGKRRRFRATSRSTPTSRARRAGVSATTSPPATAPRRKAPTAETSQAASAPMRAVRAAATCRQAHRQMRAAPVHSHFMRGLRGHASRRQSRYSTRSWAAPSTSAMNGVSAFSMKSSRSRLSSSLSDFRLVRFLCGPALRSRSRDVNDLSRWRKRSAR